VERTRKLDDAGFVGNAEQGASNRCRHEYCLIKLVVRESA
jgi:hypothetical protein